ncbi:hypothetical protein EV130_11191 [Rhizobium azibense]|uniref:Uncharacterized protein n=1 Tax=Rhizobium azibense TaxID=1136135 RepID=A0A4R3QJH0_9HYPH|nr:hypothetical protein EV130_11191 [Rhizobium azibense]
MFAVSTPPGRVAALLMTLKMRSQVLKNKSPPH